MTHRIDLSREQILGQRRAVGGLHERLPASSGSLRMAAWAGLQDSMPRAALLSIHARVAGSEPGTLGDPSLVQLWGPRFSAYAVAAEDRAVFTLGRMPDDAGGRGRAIATADRLEAHLGGRALPYGEAGVGLGVAPNSLRYATTTGRVLIRWDGARQPVIWAVPAPDVDPADARLELARRYLHVLGPGTPFGLAAWAGIKPPAARAAFEAIDGTLLPVRTPIGDAWILAGDEPAFRAPLAARPGTARLLPSGDAFFLLEGADRDLLVPDAGLRGRLWTSRVWPGAVLVGGEPVGTWRRADALVTIQPWRRLTPGEREALDFEAASLPLPGLAGPIRARWDE